MHDRLALGLALLLAAMSLSGCIGVSNMSELRARLADEGTPGRSGPAPSSNLQPVAVVDGPPSPVAVGSAVVFDAGPSRDADGTIVAVHWQVDGEAAGNGTRLNWSFATEGRHRVQATVEDDDGGTGTETVEVKAVANRPPSASMTVLGPGGEPTDRVEVGDAVTVSANASDPDGDALTYTWQVGGRQASRKEATFTLDRAGIYRVELVVEDPSGALDRVEQPLVVDRSGSTSGTVSRSSPNVTVGIDVRPQAENLSVVVDYEADLPLEDVDVVADGPGDAGAADDGDEAAMPGSKQVRLDVPEPAAGSWTVTVRLDRGLDASFSLDWSVRYGLGA